MPAPINGHHSTHEKMREATGMVEYMCILQIRVRCTQFQHTLQTTHAHTLSVHAYMYFSKIVRNACFLYNTRTVYRDTVRHTFYAIHALYIEMLERTRTCAT